jgi:hypothetical protein
MTAEAKLAHSDWSAQDASQDAVHAGWAGASGWSIAVGHALDLLGVGNLEGVQSACSMGSGRLATVAADMTQLRQRGALSAKGSLFTAVDIIGLSESEALPPGVIFKHVCRYRPKWKELHRSN